MKVKQLVDLLVQFELDKEVDLEIGGVLVPIREVQPSGECKTGVMLIPDKECALCVDNDTN